MLMLSSTAILSAKQAEYAHVLAQEFVREFTHFADIAAGRAQPRSDFIEKLWKLVLFPIKLGASAAGIMGGSAAVAVVDEVGEQWHEHRKMSKPEAIADLHDRLGFHQISIIAERAAIEAARRYHYVIDAKLTDDAKEGVIPLAKVGAWRMLEYLARYQPVADLTVTNLLNGLIEGRSGQWIDGWFNAPLKTKDKADKAFRAEGVYARSGFRGPQGGFWTLHENDALHKQWRAQLHHRLITDWKTIVVEAQQDIQQLQAKQSNASLKEQLSNFLKQLQVPFKKWKHHQLDRLVESFFSYGYVHFRSRPRQRDPKYGYADVPQAVIKTYGFRSHAVGTHSEELSQSLVEHTPRVKRVTRDDVQAYLAQLHQAGAKKQFKEYIANKYPGARVPVCIGQDLSQLALAGGDFSDCDFSETRFGGCFDDVIFNRSQLYAADFRQVTSAKAAKFSHACLIMADFGGDGADLTGADVTQAQMDYAKLGKSQLDDLQERGTSWIGVDLTQVSTVHRDALQTTQAEQQAALNVHEQTIRELYQKIDAQRQVVEGQLSQLREQLVNVDSQSAEQIQALMTRVSHEQEMRESFQIYCEAQFGELKNQQGAQQQVLDKLASHVDALEQQNTTLVAKLQKEFSALTNVVVQAKQQAVAQQQLAQQTQTLNQQLTQLQQHQQIIETDCIEAIDALQQRHFWRRIVRMVEQLAGDPLLQAQRAHYVPVKGTFNNLPTEPHKDVETEVEDFIGHKGRYEQTQVMVLLGSSGTGKTMFCQGLAVKLAREWLQATAAFNENDLPPMDAIPPIPLYAALPRLKNPQHGLLVESFKRYDFNLHELAELKNYPFIFLFDSVDEIAEDKLEGERNLHRSNNLQDWQRARTLFCCRTEYAPLYTNINQNRYTLFAPLLAGAADTMLAQQLVEALFLMPFRPEQVIGYIQQYLMVPEIQAEIAAKGEPEWANYQTYLKYIGLAEKVGQPPVVAQGAERIPGIDELVTNPFLLRVTMEALPRVVTEYKKQRERTTSFIKFTQDGLFDVYMPQWFERQKQKLEHAEGLTPDYLDFERECWGYCKTLATKMREYKLTVVTYSEDLSEMHIFTAKRTTENSIWKRFFTQTNPDVRLIRKCCPVKLVGLDPTRWAFFHEDFKTYFVTKRQEELALKKSYSVEMQLAPPSDAQLNAPGRTLEVMVCNKTELKVTITEWQRETHNADEFKRFLLIDVEDTQDWYFYGYDGEKALIQGFVKKLQLNQLQDVLIDKHIKDIEDLQSKAEILQVITEDLAHTLEQNTVFVYQTVAGWAYCISYLDDEKDMSQGEITEEEILQELHVQGIGQLSVKEGRYQLSSEQKRNLLIAPTLLVYTQPDEEEDDWIDADAMIDDIDSLKRAVTTVTTQYEQLQADVLGQLQALTQRVGQLETSTRKQATKTSLTGLPPKKHKEHSSVIEQGDAKTSTAETTLTH